tara:strand:- start:195 stop:686 length:492 start_codon:yes stop_codon:yes gene_type:complete
MHSKKANNSKRLNFIQGLRPLSSAIPHGLKKILKKNGYNFSSIVDNWTKMVGRDISDCCYPETIKISKDMNNRTLIINVLHGKEMEVEYKKKEIADKINGFFGYGCIGKIKLKVVQEGKGKIIKAISKNKIDKKFEKKLEKITNVNLKNSLDQLINAFNKKND